MMRSRQIASLLRRVQRVESDLWAERQTLMDLPSRWQAVRPVLLPANSPTIQLGMIVRVVVVRLRKARSLVVLVMLMLIRTSLISRVLVYIQHRRQLQLLAVQVVRLFSVGSFAVVP